MDLMRMVWGMVLFAAALLTPGGGYCADLIFPAGTSIAVSRAPARLYCVPGSPMDVQVTIANTTGATLRGACYTEHIPSVFTVQTLGVSLDGAPILNYIYEVASDDIYRDTDAHRWIMEEPGRYGEMNNPVPPGSTLTISYRVSTPGYYNREWPPYLFSCEREPPAAEFPFGYCDETLPFNEDTDGDGYPDGHEEEEGSNPLSGDSLPAAVAVLKETGVGDQNIYLYDVSKAGDRTYGDAVSRNFGPFARDLWVIPADNAVAGLTLVNIDAEGERELAAVKNNEGDYNLLLYEMPLPGDLTYWDARARNPSPLARDLWAIPSGNMIVGVANAGDVDGDGSEDTAVLKAEGGDQRLFVYRAPAVNDWTFWDAVARNPSPLARDLWSIPGGDDIAYICGVDTDGDNDNDHIITVRREGMDQNLYLWRMPRAGDMNVDDALARQDGYGGPGTPQAADRWVVVSGNSVIATASAEVNGTAGEELCVMKDERGDQNFYVYMLPVAGDRTYWDAVSRNPSPLARDLWVIPHGNNVVALTAE